MNVIFIHINAMLWLKVYSDKYIELAHTETETVNKKKNILSNPFFLKKTVTPRIILKTHKKNAKRVIIIND
ncbi:hypothetical protein AUJ93_01810 [bacterium CG2_30_33_46]|nr:MAG: hypothetical protein AUJ93_01810 [bacterium CG2_30_33_46]